MNEPTVCAKPTYYQFSEGFPATYIEHAAFIAANSFPDISRPGWWVYPMLRYEDRGTHYMITLVIDRFESKPKTPETTPLRLKIVTILKQELARRGLSARKWAEMSGISKSQLSSVLAGKVSPSVDMIERMFHSLGLRPVLSGEYDPEGALHV